MSAKVDKHILKNGMVVLGETIPQIESVAFEFLLPAGAAHLGEKFCGAGNILCDWVFRGAGKRSSRELSDALDGLGLHRSTHVSSSHIYLGASLEASHLLNALDLYADIILEPRLEAAQFELSRKLALLEIMGLEDDPRQKVMLELHERYYPMPLGLSTVGRTETLEAMTPEHGVKLVQTHFNPGQAVFAVAGKYDFDAVCKRLEALFFPGGNTHPDRIKTGRRKGGYTHIPHEGAQVHIGMMTHAATIQTPDYYNALVASSVLSGGMSSRLFTEVREKRGLCYAVGARYHGLKTLAGIQCYAGTTPDKAQETYDVTRAEFERLVEGITPEEMHSAKIGLKSSVIMQSESSGARASGVARDYYMLGRVRSLEEIKEHIEKTSIDSVLDYLRREPYGDYTVVTIGPEKIKTD